MASACVIASVYVGMEVHEVDGCLDILSQLGATMEFGSKRNAKETLPMEYSVRPFSQTYGPRAPHPPWRPPQIGDSLLT